MDIKNNVKRRIIVEKSGRYPVEHILLIAIIGIPMAMYLFIYLTKILPQPLIGHDVLNYGVMGRILFDEKSLAPIWVIDFSNSGFFYKIKHPPSFSLLLTWEELVNYYFSVQSDLYLRSISTYYGFLILFIQYYWVSKQNKWLAFLAAVALLSGLGFFVCFFSKHLDTYRILFFCISLIYLAYAIKEKDLLSLIMFGIFTGFTAFSHRIGVVLAVINCITFLIILDSNLISKIKKTVILIALILIFGGNHYIFDIIFGRGAWLQLK